MEPENVMVCRWIQAGELMECVDDTIEARDIYIYIHIHMSCFEKLGSAEGFNSNATGHLNSHAMSSSGGIMKK